MRRRVLKAAVKAKVRKHTVISYGDDTWDAFRETDVREVDGRLCWWDTCIPPTTFLCLPAIRA